MRVIERAISLISYHAARPPLRETQAAMGQRGAKPPVATSVPPFIESLPDGEPQNRIEAPSLERQMMLMGAFG